MRSEARELKECVAELTLENRLLKKKHDQGWEVRRMRYPASEKLEIIRLVERSQRPAKWTLDKLGVPPRTFGELLLTGRLGTPDRKLRGSL